MTGVRWTQLSGYLCTMLIVSSALSLSARADADGPDFWAVAGVGKTDVLNLRDGPSPTAHKIAGIPHDARGLKNLGCQGGPTFAQWTRMTPTERKRAKKLRWCQVEFNGKRGWVAGRFLKED